MDGAYSKASKPTIWRRLGFRSAASHFEDDEPEWQRGYIKNDTTIIFDWLDRLRVLVSGKVAVSLTIRTDAKVDKTQSVSGVGVLPPTHPVRP